MQLGTLLHERCHITLSPSLAHSELHLCPSLQMNQVQIGLPQAGCGKYLAV